MKKRLRRALSLLLAGLMLASTMAACTPTTPPEVTTAGNDATEAPTETPTEAPTDEEETDPPVTEPPALSLDQLTFTPASLSGQVLTEKGHSPQILIRNYNETATDALGRVLPTSAEAGLPKEGKYVGLFYSLWTVGSTCDVDNSKVMATNPYKPNFGPPGASAGGASPRRATTAPTTSGRSVGICTTSPWRAWISSTST